MARTFDREVRQILQQNGGHEVRKGGKHDIWYSPISNRNFSVPTKIKSRHTANEILKQAGLEKQF